MCGLSHITEQLAVGVGDHIHPYNSGGGHKTVDHFVCPHWNHLAEFAVANDRRYRRVVRYGQTRVYILVGLNTCQDHAQIFSQVEGLPRGHERGPCTCESKSRGASTPFLGRITHVSLG